MSGEVLTKDEAEMVSICREHNTCSLVTVIDRLVSEVARLRAWRDAAESQYGRDTLAAEVVRLEKERDALRARNEKLEIENKDLMSKLECKKPLSG